MNLQKVALNLLLACTVSFSAFAATSNETSSETTLKVVQDIETIIDRADVDFDDLGETTVRVKFLVNAANQIIVLSTDNPSLDNTFKSMLNYHKVDTKDIDKYHVYVVPVSFKNA